jgi:glycerol-3-phosphate dehydrogenase
MKNIFDVAIIGAGAVGSAIARELSRYELNVVLLEANSDVGMGTSKASTAIWHTGYDATPGSLESVLLKRGYPLLEEFMKEVGSPFERIGGLLIAWNEDQLQTLPKLLQKAIENGDTDCYLIDRDEVYEREPHLGKGALGGMFVPSEGILCTFTIPIALATQAVVNGVTLKLNFNVKSIQKADSLYTISNEIDEISARWIINAAGLYSDEINAYFGINSFKVGPRRGELIVFDKLARTLVNHVLLPVPTATTKGVLVSPTIYGNVLLGPTAEETSDKSATYTSMDGLNVLMEKGRTILPELLNEEVTASYAGLRAATEFSDYQISLHPDKGYICVGGIRSTGISGCLGIAEFVHELLEKGGEVFRTKHEFKKIRMPNIGEAFQRSYQSAEKIASDSDNGKIVCHCERVTLGELKDAMTSPIPAQSLDALRRRTRAMQGRCQGFNCHPTLVTTLGRSKEFTIERAESTEKNTKNSLSSVVKSADVLIVGAGPAGLSAALELKKLGVKNIVVAEREPEIGGIPRFCGHTGFGVRDFHRVLSGPSYARKYRELTEKAGIKIHTSTTITGWDDSKLRKSSETSEVFFTAPNGLGTIEAKSILLATGVRERPRSARLVPGTRPQGVFTTGSLQRFVYEHHLPVGKRAVIVGAEIVSLSVVVTLLHAGVRVVNMITELPHHQLYLPIFLPAKILYADILARIPILTNKRVTNILGYKRVEGIEITDIDSDTSEVIGCDTVVFTGNWIPENELARRGNVETSKPSLGPQVDSLFRTSQYGIFAAGNVLRGVETADWAALEGRRAAGSIARFLENTEWPANRIPIQVETPLDWICPNVITDSTPTEFRFRSREFRNHVKLGIYQGERLLHIEHFSRLLANVSVNLTRTWSDQVDRLGEAVRIVLH